MCCTLLTSTFRILQIRFFLHKIHYHANRVDFYYFFFLIYFCSPDFTGNLPLELCWFFAIRRQIFRCRITATLRRSQIKISTASSEYCTSTNNCCVSSHDDMILKFCELFSCQFNVLMENPRGDAGGLSREYVLRIPSVS